MYVQRSGTWNVWVRCIGSVINIELTGMYTAVQTSFRLSTTC